MSGKAELRRHERSCEGKVRHAKRDAALSALMHLVRTRGAVLAQHEVYKCRACSTWHFGHRIRRRGSHG